MRTSLVLIVQCIHAFCYTFCCTTTLESNENFICSYITMFIHRHAFRYNPLFSNISFIWLIVALMFINIFFAQTFHVFVNILCISWQGVSYHIVLPFDVFYIQIISLQDQTPSHQSLIFVLHLVNECERIMICQD